MGILNPIKNYHVLILDVLFFSSFILMTVSTKYSVKVYVYGFQNFQSLGEIKSYFSGLPEVKIIDYSLNDPCYSNEFLEIINSLVMRGVRVLPPDFCNPCTMALGLKVYIYYSSPLLLFFHGGKLTAISISRWDTNTLNQALIYSGNTVKVFLQDGTTCSLDEDIKIRIERMFKLKMEPQEIIVTAFVDAINTYEFFLLVALLLLVAMCLKGASIIHFGVAYSIAIFLVYILAEIGVWKSVGYVREAKIIVAVLWLSMGFVLNLSLGLPVSLEERIEGFLNQRLKDFLALLLESFTKYLKKFLNSPLSAFIIGLAASTFLLPYTSLPYFTADIETGVQRVPLLLLYNGVITISLLAITASVYLLQLKIGGLSEKSSAERRLLSLAGGLLMMIIGIYLLVYAL